MAEANRISPEETRVKVLIGQALLVCAYTDDTKLAQYHLEGAITLSALQDQTGELPKNQEIIFY